MRYFTCTLAVGLLTQFLRVDLASASAAPWEVCRANPTHLACVAAQFESLREIGSQQDPNEFFTENVARRQPAVLRGAVSGATAIATWTDDHLARHFGDLELKLEEKREKDGHWKLNGTLGLGRETLLNFLKGMDSNAYVVSQLPTPMYEGLLVPAVASSGPLEDTMLEANIWISNGGTRSLLHRDADNVFNCVVKGIKHWVLLDPTAAASLPMSTERPSEVGGFALTNPEQVSSEASKVLSQYNVSVATVHPGDCLYLPWGYLHQVTTPQPGTRSIAYSMLFPVTHRAICKKQGAQNSSDISPPTVNSQQGAATDYSSPVPLEQQPPLWEYTGTGLMSMGNADPQSVLRGLRTFIRSKGSCSPADGHQQGSDAVAETHAAAAAEWTRSTCGVLHLDEAIENAQNRAPAAWTNETESYVRNEWTNAGFESVVPGGSPEEDSCAPRPDVVDFLVRLVEASSEAEVLQEERPKLKEAAQQWVMLADSDLDGVVSVSEVQAASSRESISALLPLLDYDPTNSPIYELYKVSHEHVREAVSKAAVSQQGGDAQIDCVALAIAYQQDAGGSHVFARALCTYLDGIGSSIEEAVHGCQDSEVLQATEAKDQQTKAGESRAKSSAGRTAREVGIEMGIPEEGLDKFEGEYKRVCEQWEEAQIDPDNDMFGVPPPPGYEPRTQAGKATTRKHGTAGQPMQPSMCADLDDAPVVVAGEGRLEMLYTAYKAREMRGDPALEEANSL